MLTVGLLRRPPEWDSSQRQVGLGLWLVVLQLLIFAAAVHPQYVAEIDSLYTLAVQTSYELNSLALEIAALEERLKHNNLFHRLMPAVNLSAYMGTSGIIFINPEETAATSTYPRLEDWVGITFSLPINKIFDSRRSTLLKIQLLSKRLEYAKIEKDLRYRLQQKFLERSHLASRLKDGESELQLRQAVLEFAELQFNEGKIEYNELTSKRLALQSAESALARIRYLLSTIELELERASK